MYLRNASIAILELLLIVCAPLALTNLPQNSEAKSTLAAADSKLWIFKRFDTFMGEGNKCTQGEGWTFHSNGRLEITKCNNGRVTTVEKRWSLEERPPLDIVVKVDQIEYTLLFPPKKPGSNKEEMRLRLKPKEKISPTRDLVFYHEID